jgi:hypothetical protein
VAADIVVADHGSVVFYAASIGVPVLLASFADDQVLESSPLAVLGQAAPRLDFERPFRPQVEEVIRAHDRTAYSGLVEGMFAFPGSSLQITRDAIYELIDLEPPAPAPRVLAVGLPEVQAKPVTAWVAFAHVDAYPAPGGTTLYASVERYPATLGGGVTRHLVVDESDADERLLQNAAIITRQAPVGHPGARAWAEGRLGDYPGCRVAASVDQGAGTAIVVVREGPSLVMRSAAEAQAAIDPVLFVSAVYAVLVQGRLDELKGIVSLRQPPCSAEVCSFPLEAQ